MCLDVCVSVVPAVHPGDGCKFVSWNSSCERVRQTRFGQRGSKQIDAMASFDRRVVEEQDDADAVVEIKDNWKSMKLHGRKILCASNPMKSIRVERNWGRSASTGFRSSRQSSGAVLTRWPLLLERSSYEYRSLLLKYNACY